MTFYDALRDDLVERSNALAADAAAPRSVRRRRWSLIGLSVAALGLGVGGTFAAVAELSEPASRIARESVGGPRGIAPGYAPISLRNAGEVVRWEVAAFEDRRGGLGMTASTTFDPDPANGATAASEVLRELREHGGAMVYGVVQADDDPQHVVVYGAALPGRDVEVQGQPVRFAERTVGLTGWSDRTGRGRSLGFVRVFAGELRLESGATADRLNGTFRGAADGTLVRLTASP